MFEEPRRLLVVYKDKDEVALNQLKKYIETNDDTDKERHVGTEDGSVKVIAWNEKTWLDNKKAGNTGDLDDKILFLGDIKGVDKLIPTLDKKDCKHGVYYGFSGKQAVIMVDGMKIAGPKAYAEFLDDLKKICDADTVDKKLHFDLNNVGRTVMSGMKSGIISLFSPLVGMGTAFRDVILDNETCRLQQLLYGVAKLYYDDLDAFMKR